MGRIYKFHLHPETSALLLCREHLAEAQERALADQKDAQNRFRDWARTKVPDAAHMNVGSGQQVRQLLFAGIPNNNPAKNETLELSRVFKVSLLRDVQRF